MQSATSPSPRSETIIVSAAISLKDAFQELGDEFQKKDPSTRVTFNFASSGDLQLQIEHGAPVDVFASASPQQLDALEKKGLLAPGTRRNFAGNTAVLVVPKNSKLPFTAFADLCRPEVRHVSIGNPGSVPAGIYAKQVLTSLKLWDSLQSRMVYGENVRQVLTYVENAEVQAGIVYATDAAISESVKVAAQAPPGSSQPIMYPIAAIAASKQHDRAQAFVDLVTGSTGQAVLSKYGFLPVPR